MTTKPKTDETEAAVESPAEDASLVHVAVVLLCHTIGAKYGDVVSCNPERAAYLVAEGHAAYPA